MNTTDVDVLADVLSEALSGHRKVLEKLVEERTAQFVDAAAAADLVRRELEATEERLMAFARLNADTAIASMQRAATEELTRLQDLLLRRMETADGLLRDVQALRQELAQDGATAREEAAAARVQLVKSMAQSLDERVADAARAMERSADERIERWGALLQKRLVDADALLRQLQQIRAELEAARDGMRNGVDAFELAQLRGFKGNEQEWLESLRGAPGTSPRPEDIARLLADSQAFQASVHGRDGAGIDAPAWEPRVHREGVTVQHHLGQFYRALRDTASEPPGDDWQRLGTAGLRVTGGFVEGRQYADGDVFVRDFGLFLWHRGAAHLLVGRGAKGDPGDRGKPGKDADPAKDGKPGARIESVELRGSAMVLLQRDADGVLGDLSVDLGPIFDASLSVVDEKLTGTCKALRVSIEEPLLARIEQLEETVRALSKKGPRP